MRTGFYLQGIWSNKLVSTNGEQYTDTTLLWSLRQRKHFWRERSHRYGSVSLKGAINKDKVECDASSGTTTDGQCPLATRFGLTTKMSRTMTINKKSVLGQQQVAQRNSAYDIFIEQIQLPGVLDDHHVWLSMSSHQWKCFFNSSISPSQLFCQLVEGNAHCKPSSTIFTARLYSVCRVTRTTQDLRWVGQRLSFESTENLLAAWLQINTLVSSGLEEICVAEFLGCLCNCRRAFAAREECSASFAAFGGPRAVSPSLAPTRPLDRAVWSRAPRRACEIHLDVKLPVAAD